MKLKKTMQDWGNLVFEPFPKNEALRHLDDALHDLGVMFNENARLTAQLAERDKRIDAQNQTIAAFLQSNAMDRAQLAEREGAMRVALGALRCVQSRYTLIGGSQSLVKEALAALARFHAAENNQ